MTDIVPQREVKFYTTGFSGRDINDLKPMLNRFDAVLVDLRFSPTNEPMRWRQIYLKALLRYERRFDVRMRRFKRLPPSDYCQRTAVQRLCSRRTERLETSSVCLLKFVSLQNACFVFSSSHRLKI